jgi:hypothetical protein
MINVLLIMLLAMGSQSGGRTLAEGDGVVSRVFVRKSPSLAALEDLVADRETDVRSRLVVRLVIYDSGPDLDRAEGAKTTDVSLEAWKERFSEERRLARPAAEFVKVGGRACQRFFDGTSVTVKPVAGYREIDRDLCAGCSLEFLYLGTRMIRTLQGGVAPYPNVDLFFVYKGSFTEDRARAVMTKLGLDSVRHANVVFAPDPSNVLATDYPYFNRFINQELYSSLSSEAGKHVSCWTGADLGIGCATF